MHSQFFTSVDVNRGPPVAPLRQASAREPLNSRSTLVAIVGIATIYVAAAKFGFTMAYTAEQVTLVWPPAGLSLAALLLIDIKVWPGVFLGAFVANIITHEPLFVATGIAIGNTLEAVTAAWVLRRFVGTPN